MENKNQIESQIEQHKRRVAEEQRLEKSYSSGVKFMDIPEVQKCTFSNFGPDENPHRIN